MIAKVHAVKQWANKRIEACTGKMRRLQIQGAVLWRIIAMALGNIAISVITIVAVSTALCFPESQKALENFQASEAVLTSLGATFGTILALVLTLSLIPIQRAGEMWSPSIIRLYRRDTLTHITFIVLGTFCAASFMLAVKGVFGIPTSIIIPIAIVALGLSLDLLRWYHRHVCKLLDPAYAVRTVIINARKTIDQIQRAVAREANLKHGKLTAQQKEKVNLMDIEAAMYPLVSGYPSAINGWIHDVSEIAGKATSRGDKYLASAAITAIQEIVNYFLIVRKKNLTLSPAPGALFLVPESDVKVVTTQAYEALQEISRTASAIGDEITAIKVLEAFENIATLTTNLQSPRFHSNTAPLAGTPIGYLMSCVKYAQEKGLEDVPFQGAEILSRISLAAPKNIALTDVHIPVIDGIYEITLQLYVKRNAALADHTVGHLMAVLGKLLICEEFHYEELLGHVLEKLEVMAPFAVINAQLAGSINMTSPLGKAYGLTNSQSLGYLFEKATSSAKIDPEREWINPYHDLENLMDIYQRHFRNIGGQVEFADSFLLWELTHLIKHIAIVVGRLVSHPIRPGRGDEQALVDKLEWILSFFWVAFDKKKTVSQQRADEACDVLVYVGLLFFDLGFPDVLKSSVSYIKSIVNSYCEIVRPPHEYAIGDFFAHLWCLRVLATDRGNTTLAGEIDRVLNTKPEPLTDEQWQQVQQAIELRRRQLEERLGEYQSYTLSDKTEELLQKLLQVRSGEEQ